MPAQLSKRLLTIATSVAAAGGPTIRPPVERATTPRPGDSGSPRPRTDTRPPAEPRVVECVPGGS
jgi:hypothetical protein